MQFDELYKFLGYGLVCLLLFYIAAKSLRFQLGIIEGLVGIKKDKTKPHTDEDQAQQDQAQQDQAQQDQAQQDQAEEDQAEENQAEMDQAELDHE
jgi:hypothetical protein